ncbi:MAG: hypothetical protein JWN04_614 [Myxococcaceae bacterium]|nr:hypothetical protein [Myxococcaceae bacterium]
MARHCKRFCLFVAALGWLGSSSEARAYDEQMSLDFALGYALLAAADRATSQGGAAELGVGFGASESIVLRANVGYAALAQRRDAKRDVSQIGRLRAEALYQLDVLQVVPFFGLGATLTTAQDSAARLPLRVGGHIVLGVDYLLSRRWICGVDLRTALLTDGQQLLSATDISLRLSRMFETF